MRVLFKFESNVELNEERESNHPPDSIAVISAFADWEAGQRRFVCLWVSSERRRRCGLRFGNVTQDKKTVGVSGGAFLRLVCTGCTIVVSEGVRLNRVWFGWLLGYGAERGLYK